LDPGRRPSGAAAGESNRIATRAGQAREDEIPGGEDDSGSGADGESVLRRADPDCWTESKKLIGRPGGAEDRGWTLSGKA
jgi:hypothetical protein